MAGYYSENYFGTLDKAKDMVDTLRKEFSDRGVYFFSYDWRQSSEDNAKLLKAFIDSLGTPKVDLVCHSMGGLVASSYYKQNIGNHKINRIVTRLWNCSERIVAGLRLIRKTTAFP
ncbi:MAG: hypothetical protein LBR87_05870 [Synergistaceae bacterium]|jgi:triacylglycerol esterase/lipase EstA (alpha/beta hydrolase family)|nr:hypothetical protein [Synergistaceae bacterium]